MKKSTREYLLSSTSNFSPFNISASKTDPKREAPRRNRGIPRSSSDDTVTGSSTRTAIFEMRPKVQVPPLSESDIQNLNEHKPPKYLTRYIKKEFYEGALEGYYHFGTIRFYRSEEQGKVGRLGDHTEAMTREFYNSSEGPAADFHDYENHVHIQASTSGADDQIRIVHEINNYCSCASIGEMTQEHVHRLRAKGNDDIGAYVTYDYTALRAALAAELASDPGQKHLRIVGKRVKYAHRDRDVAYAGRHDYQRPDPKKLWLNTAFLKPPFFEHENEFRILLADPADAAGLDMDAKPKGFSSPKIAAAIVGKGILEAVDK